MLDGEYDWNLDAFNIHWCLVLNRLFASMLASLDADVSRGHTAYIVSQTIHRFNKAATSGATGAESS